MNSNTYFCENFSGFFFRNKVNGRCYLIAGETDTRITEVTGLDTLRTGTMPLKISAEDHAQAIAVAKRQGKAAADAAPLAIDRVADPAAWRPAAAARLDAGAGRTAAIALGYDDGFLHASFDVQDDSPLKNAGGDPAMLFKTGDSVNLHLATDPAADPQRTQPAPGDVRLLVTVVEDQPVVVLYEPVARPGTRRNRGRSRRRPARSRSTAYGCWPRRRSGTSGGPLATGWWPRSRWPICSCRWRPERRFAAMPACSSRIPAARSRRRDRSCSTGTRRSPKTCRAKPGWNRPSGADWR